MNRDQIKGRMKEAAGTLQQKAGKAVESPSHQIKGMAKRAAGKVQKTAGDIAERARDDERAREKDR
jgi:uncharacterized protein YjbJ (UPF0337 family)